MSVPQVETPMMRQFNAIKREHPDKLLFYRMGDFYEMFGDDAIVGAKVLQIALTSRNKNKSLPMCGVPYRAYEQYLNKLTAAGYKVAICEQMEDPAIEKPRPGGSLIAGGGVDLRQEIFVEGDVHPDGASFRRRKPNQKCRRTLGVAAFQHGFQ